MAKAGRPKGTSDIAPKIRSYFKRAIEKLEKKGKPLDDLIVEALENDLKGTLTALSKYVPTEIDLNTDTESAENMTDEQLLSIAKTGSAGASKKTEGPE